VRCRAGARAGPALLAAAISCALQPTARGAERAPVLYWDRPAETATELRAAGIFRILVPPERIEEWKGTGVAAAPLGAEERASRLELAPPGIVGRVDVASATRRPWIDANGWRFVRQPGLRGFLAAPRGAAVLAAVEASAYGADVVLAADPTDLPELGEALAFFASLPEGPPAAIADLGVVDDGSTEAGELMNLLARRNLLFRPAARDAAGLPLVIELGTTDWPRSKADDPDALALEVRTRLTDARRSLRLFGSEVVLARLTGDDDRRRVQLLNYGGRTVSGLRVRLRGRWQPGTARALGRGELAVDAPLVEDDATEFSLPGFGTYAVVDLATPR
jgi:hypothetical protein